MALNLVDQMYWNNPFILKYLSCQFFFPWRFDCNSNPIARYFNMRRQIFSKRLFTMQHISIKTNKLHTGASMTFRLMWNTWNKNTPFIYLDSETAKWMAKFWTNDKCNGFGCAIWTIRCQIAWRAICIILLAKKDSSKTNGKWQDHVNWK